MNLPQLRAKIRRILPLVSSPRSVFIDACIFQHAGQPTKREKEDRSLMWGGHEVRFEVEVESPRKVDSGLLDEMGCLRRLGPWIYTGQVVLFSSLHAALELPAARSHLVLSRDRGGRQTPIEIGIVEDHLPSSAPILSSGASIEQLLAMNPDPRFREIQEGIGKDKMVDAYHILAAERAGLDFFLTTDRKLLNSIRNPKHIGLSVREVSPCELIGVLEKGARAPV